MARFLALVWDEREAASLQYSSRVRQLISDAGHWVTVTHGAGLAVYVDQTYGALQECIPLDRDAGVILGTLFKQSTSASDGAKRESSIGAPQTAGILHTHGRSLVDSNWGSYVLFLRRPLEHTISVLRGPAGSLPCYYLTYHRCTLLLSHTADLVWVCPQQLTINLDSIRAQAAAGDYLTRETGLSEVSAVLSGECLDIHEGQVTRRSYWNPAKLCANPVGRLSDAATLLHSETHRCVNAWASLHDAVLMLLSGGLDSSIVLACLRRPPASTRVVAVNFYSAGAGDERRFARSMGEKTTTLLEEIPSNLNIDLRDFLQCSLTPSPVLNFTAFDVEPVMRTLAQRWNATAIFTGETGDDVFGHAPAPEALAEILQHFAQVHRFFPAAMDYAELTRVSVWRAMHLACQYLKWFRRMGTWSAYHHRHLVGQSSEHTLVLPEAMRAYGAMLPRFTHPWFQDADDMPLGKAMLIYSIIKATSSVSQSPFSETAEAPMVSPLISQPLLEATLRVPSYLHFSGAENGAVARAAFRSALSPQVLERGTGKGIPAMWARSLLDTNVVFLSELLLDGLLVKNRILDRKKIQTLLAKDVSRTRLGVADLIRQVYIELWLRRWTEAGARL